jgi:thiopurine S-methyltransferase
MESDFWIERWKEKQIGFHQDEINAHLQDFWPRLNVPEGSTVFVPLCGKSSDMLWLRAQGYKVLGIELSPIAVQEFFDENDLVPTVTEVGKFERWESDSLTLLCGNFFDLTPEDLNACNGVFDRASLIALPPEMRNDYAEHMKSIMPEAAEILLVTMEYPQEEMSGPPFSVHESEVRGFYDQAYTISVLFEQDILTENPRFGEQGISQLIEKVYQLTPR